MKRSSPLLVPSLLALLAAVSCGAETWTLAPTIDQRKTCRMVTMALEGNHYRRLAVDDELSRRGHEALYAAYDGPKEHLTDRPGPRYRPPGA